MNTGELIASTTVPTDGLRFLRLGGNTTVDPDGGVLVDDPSPRCVQLDYDAFANLPLLFPNLDIDMVGMLGIHRDNHTFRFRGSGDGFPAFEAYISFNLRPPVTLFRLVPVAPIFLVGDVNRALDVKVAIIV